VSSDGFQLSIRPLSLEKAHGKVPMPLITDDLRGALMNVWII